MQRQYNNSDEQLSHLLSHIFKKNTPLIYCPQKRKTNTLCLNHQCKYALRCSQPKCKSCGTKSHKGCQTIQLEQLTMMINEKTDVFRYFRTKIVEIEKKFLAVVRKNQLEFLQKYAFIPVGSQHRRLIKDIYQNMKFEALSGSQAAQIVKQLEKQNSFSSQEQMIIIDKYSNSMEKVSQQLYRIQKQCYSQATNLQKIQTQVQKESILDSQVLRMRGNIQSDVKYIQQLLHFPKQTELIFRASEHGYKVSSFHSHCDNIEDTFILLRTEFGKTIGGYTHYKWMYPQAGTYINDQGRKSFLVQLDIKQAMFPISNQNLIFCSSLMGPCFGGGHDLCIGDRCNVDRSSHTQFPYTYNTQQGKQQYTRSQQSYQALSGNPKGWSFLIQQYEVFRILYH